MNTIDTVGNKIRKLRKEKHWSQKQLANKLGFKQSYISNIEIGKNKLNKINIVYKFLDIFNISFDLLFMNSLTNQKFKEKSQLYKEIEFELSQMNTETLKITNNIILEFIKYKSN